MPTVRSRYGLACTAAALALRTVLLGDPERIHLVGKRPTAPRRFRRRTSPRLQGAPAASIDVGTLSSESEIETAQTISSSGGRSITASFGLHSLTGCVAPSARSGGTDCYGVIRTDTGWTGRRRLSHGHGTLVAVVGTAGRAG